MNALDRWLRFEGEGTATLATSATKPPNAKQTAGFGAAARGDIPATLGDIREDVAEGAGECRRMSPGCRHGESLGNPQIPSAFLDMSPMSPMSPPLMPEADGPAALPNETGDAGEQDRRSDEADASLEPVYLNDRGWRFLLSWTEGVLKLDTATPPSGMTAVRWQELIDDAVALLDRWAAPALALGWDEAALFGLCRDLPDLASPTAGLVAHLRGGRVTALTAAAAAILDADGGVRQVRRVAFRPWNTTAPWNLAAPNERDAR